MVKQNRKGYVKADKPKVIPLYDEEGEPRSAWEVLTDVKQIFESPTIDGGAIVLDEDELGTEPPEELKTEEIRKMFAWGIENTDTNGNTEIYPISSDKITIHGAEEMWFFICRLLDHIQTA